MDISVSIGEGRFNFRVALVLINQGRVLLHKNSKARYWALPGGRVKMYETTLETGVREIKEELGIEIKIERLLWLMENFFNYEGEAFHEIGYYYLAELADLAVGDLGEKAFVGQEEGKALLYQWIPLEQLADLSIQPSFLQEGLQSLPSIPELKVIKD